MLDPRLLYSFSPALWETMRGKRPILLHLWDGYIDAGLVSQALSEHLLTICRHETLVEFDHDQLHDYRGRRPRMIFDTDHFVSAGQFSLKLLKMWDASGQVFLLLTGREPDLQWERTSTAITELVQRLDVKLVVNAYGIPMGVPHSRPTMITYHATRSDLLPRPNPVWIGRMEVPGGFGSFLELNLGKAGVDALSVGANVPHYLAESRFYQAILAALDAITTVTGLDLPTGGLHDAESANNAEIASEVEDSTEVQQVVSMLETQYDQQADGDLPSADEIGAELERFLHDENRKQEYGGPASAASADDVDRADPPTDRGPSFDIPDPDEPGPDEFDPDDSDGESGDDRPGPTPGR